VLLSLTPPVGTPIVGVSIGGLRFLTLATGLGRSNEQHDLDVDGASDVHGYIRSACPFEVTLTPQAESYGLPTTTYVTRTSAVQTAAAACRDNLALSGQTQEFVVDVPPGTYDVYIRPTTSLDTPDGGATDCGAVPELFPALVRAQAGVSCVSIKQVTPQKLEVHIPWPSDAPPLDGWTLDVIHPVTGQVLSQTSAPLSGGPEPSSSGSQYVHTVTYSPIASDSSLAGQELLRLSLPQMQGQPPPTVPVLQFSVAAAIALSPPTANGIQKANLPSNIGPFPPAVKVETSVYREDEYAKGVVVGVPSTVTFTATNLVLPSMGIFASYSATAMVGADGKLDVELLPGDYLVRIVPAVDPSSDVNLASQELSITVRPDTSAVQVVRDLLVKTAAVVKGRAFSASGGGIASASVQALPAAAGTRRCTGADASAAACAAEPVGVLETSLAESAYVPRTATAVTARDGTFVLSDVDCGGCDKQDGASFDVVVQTPDGTRVPWLVWPQVVVADDLDLPPMHATLPIIQRGTVQLPSAMMGAPTAIPGTLIRAYVIRDASGAPILDPTGLPSCSSGTYTGDGKTTRCIRSALQVAETRADMNGNYELALPASVDATPE
jgi:hypothetical protein